VNFSIAVYANAADAARMVSWVEFWRDEGVEVAGVGVDAARMVSWVELWRDDCCGTAFGRRGRRVRAASGGQGS
jgi:aryl carrier-like protein